MLERETETDRITERERETMSMAERVRETENERDRDRQNGIITLISLFPHLSACFHTYSLFLVTDCVIRMYARQFISTEKCMFTGTVLGTGYSM